MNPIKYCILVSILVSSVFAQESGFFFSAGGGVARMSIDRFSVYNPVASIPGQPLGEALPVLNRKDTVPVARLTLGYAFNEAWDVRFSFSNYGTADVPIAFPQYPGMVFVTAPDAYLRHSLVYQTSALSLMPSYRIALSDRVKLRMGVGLSWSTTEAHFEDIRRGTISGDIRLNRHPAFDDSRLSYLASLGLDCRLSEKASVGLNVNYTTTSAEIPNSPWVNRTKSNVDISSLSTELALTWHW